MDDEWALGIDLTDLCILTYTVLLICDEKTEYILKDVCNMKMQIVLISNWLTATNFNTVNDQVKHYRLFLLFLSYNT